MRLLAAVLTAVLAACEGTEGTLLIRGSGAPGAGGEPNEAFVPSEDARWLAQLDGPVDISAAADFFYLDPEQQPAADLAALHAQGRHYLCYLSAGTLESFRGDAELFPERVVGNVTSSFPNERWLDVRDAEVRALMARRIEALAAAGCDGVTPASLTGYGADSGFDLTLAEWVDYARFLADELHRADMSAGLTGPPELTSALWQSFDFGLAIDCVRGSQCREYDVLRDANKPVLHLELGEAADAPAICKDAETLGFSALVSDRGFSGRCVFCRDIL